MVMTANEATSFSHKSIINAHIVRARLPCGCQPYEDVFTFKRWLAQGMVVKRGEHGIKLIILKECEEEDEDGNIITYRQPAGAVVFCRHQVKTLENHKAIER